MTIGAVLGILLVLFLIDVVVFEGRGTKWFWSKFKNAFWK